MYMSAAKNSSFARAVCVVSFVALMRSPGCPATIRNSGAVVADLYWSEAAAAVLIHRASGPAVQLPGGPVDVNRSGPGPTARCVRRRAAREAPFSNKRRSPNAGDTEVDA